MPNLHERRADTIAPSVDVDRKRVEMNRQGRQLHQVSASDGVHSDPLAPGAKKSQDLLKPQAPSRQLPLCRYNALKDGNAARSSTS